MSPIFVIRRFTDWSCKCSTRSYASSTCLCFLTPLLARSIITSPGKHSVVLIQGPERSYWILFRDVLPQVLWLLTAVLSELRPIIPLRTKRCVMLLNEYDMVWYGSLRFTHCFCILSLQCQCYIQFHVKAVVSRRFTRLPTYNVEETGHRELRRSSLHGNYSR